MSVLSGYLVDAMGWRWMFIMQGLPALIWAFIWWTMIDEKPRNARWLTFDEKQALEIRLRKEQKDIKPVKNYAAAFKSSAVIDRKSVEKGNSVSVRVDLGGRRIIKKKISIEKSHRRIKSNTLTTKQNLYNEKV